jgi:hypothetical protein
MKLGEKRVDKSGLQDTKTDEEEKKEELLSCSFEDEKEFEKPHDYIYPELANEYCKRI